MALVYIVFLSFFDCITKTTAHCIVVTYSFLLIIWGENSYTFSCIENLLQNYLQILSKTSDGYYMCNKLNILSRRKSSHKITEWLCHWLMQMWTHTLLIVVAWPWLAARCPTCSSLTSPQQNSWEKYHETTCRLRQVEKSLVSCHHGQDKLSFGEDQFTGS